MKQNRTIEQYLKSPLTLHLPESYGKNIPVLDSIIFCIHNSTSRVKYLGDISKAEEIFKSFFPDVTYSMYPERKFNLYNRYPRLIGLIDIETGYQFRRNYEKTSR